MTGAIDNTVWLKMTLVLMTSHDQKCHIAPHFNFLDLRNAVVPLMMLLALCDAGANSVTSPKEACCISFQLSLPKENCGATYDAGCIM